MVDVFKATTELVIVDDVLLVATYDGVEKLEMFAVDELAFNRAKTALGLAVFDEAAVCWYILRRLLPPQNSVEFAEHAILHPVADTV